MKINSIYLKGYKRLMLSSIQEITIHSESPLSLILGTNGSGKSSLLHELSPLPPTPSDYDPGGIKRVHITHNQSDYVVESIIGKITKHSFKKNDKELNPGHTGVVQKELIKTELDYDKTYHRLMSGRLRFTDMSVKERMELLTSVSGLNLDYAYRLLAYFNTQYRDKVGVIKHLKNKEEDAISTLMTIEDITDVLDELDTLHKKLTLLIPHTTGSDADTETLTLEYTQCIDKLKHTISSYGNTVVYMNATGYESYDALLNDRYMVKAELAVLEKDKNALLIQIDELNSVTNAMPEGPDGGIKVKEQLNALRRALDAPVSPLQGKYTGSHALAMSTAETALIELRRCLMELSDTAVPCTDKDLKTVKIELENTSEEKRLILTGISKLTQFITQAEANLEAALTCPKCNTKVSSTKIITESEIAAQKQRLEKGQLKLVDIEKQIDVLSTRISNMQNYLSYENNIAHVVTNCGILDSIWSSFGNITTIATEVRHVIDVLSVEYIMLQEYVEREQLQDEYNKLEQLNRLYEAHGNLDLTAETGKLESKLQDYYKKETTLTGVLHRINVIDDGYSGLVKAISTVTEQQNEASDKLQTLAEAIFTTSVNAEVKTTQLRLSELQSVLNNRTQLEDQIKSYHDDIIILTKEKDTLAMLVSNLSPKEGVIADQMTAFVSRFIDGVNDVISNVWEYSMVIDSCGTSEYGLDYKFPITIDGETGPEIANTSKGQRDIIDFAFTVVLAGHLGISDNPLYIDELGATFDTVHQNKVLHYIRHLLETSYCSQIFMVNHYSDAYGGFTNMDVVVLDSTNIEIPDAYNEGVVILRS